MESRHAQRLESESAHDDVAADDLELAPGRITHSEKLTRPETPSISGLVQRRARDGRGVTDGADRVVGAALSSSGAPLPGGLRTKFEAALGADLAGVRVHTGESSAAAADAVGAKAFTIGQDIHFAAGQFDPTSAAGEHLLAHEVAHTVQQAGGAAKVQHKLVVSSPGDVLENEADRAADAMVQGTAVAVTGQGPSRELHRKAEGYIAGGLPTISDDATEILVKMPDIEIAKRRSKSKAWTLLDKKQDITVVDDLPIDLFGVKAALRVKVIPRASMMIGAGVGPVKVNNIYVRLNLKDMSPSELAKLGKGGAQDEINDLSPLLQSGLKSKHASSEAAAAEIARAGHHEAHGQIDAPADASAVIQGSAAAEASVRDPSGMLGVGAGGGLQATGTARARANAGVGLTFTYDDGEPDLEADLHFDFATRLAFGLSGFIYGFFELTDDKKGKDPATKPPAPGGKSDGIFTIPPGWPKELEWLIPDVFKEPEGPDGPFRVEWKKTFPIVSKQLEEEWHVKASAHIDADDLSDFVFSKPDVDLLSVLRDFVEPQLAANDEIPQNEKQAKQQSKSKLDGKVKGAAKLAKAAINTADDAFSDKRSLVRKELEWVDESLADVPPADQADLRAYQLALQKVSGQLDKQKGVVPGLRKDFDVAKAEGDKSEDASKKHAIAELQALEQNANHFTDHIAALATPERPELESGTEDGKATPVELARAAVLQKGWGILRVMRSLVALETIPVDHKKTKGKLDFEIYMQAWATDAEWHKNQFRRVCPASHEWFPCSNIPDYIASDAANFVQGDDWVTMVIDLANDLRTHTQYMVFDPSKASVVEDGKVVLQGHSGAPLWFAGDPQITGQPAFHAELKRCFYNGVRLYACLTQMEAVADAWIWAGTNPERVHPDMQSSKTGPKLDVANLAKVQRLQHANIQLMFELQIGRLHRH